MMTLGFIAVITALIMWSVSISKHRFDKVVALKAENQFSLVFKDFTKLITKFDINSSDGLAMFLSMKLPTLIEPVTKIGLGFYPDSMMDKLNINYILDALVVHESNATNPNHVALLRRPLEKFFRSYELSSPDIMIDFLLDTIDMDDFERSSYSEIATENFDFRQGKIYDFNHFTTIKEHYYKSTHDENIFKITKSAFEKIFYFGEPKEKNLLDCTRDQNIDPSAVMALLVDDEMMITESTDYCAESNTTAMKTLKDIYNISQFANKKKYLVKCVLNLVTENDLREISFDFDVSSKRISNIDKNFQEQE